MVNITLPEFINDTLPTMISNCIPEQACSFYHGYYTMSGDMGALILKLGLLFFALDLIHYLIKSLSEYYLVPKFKTYFDKKKKEEN